MSEHALSEGMIEAARRLLAGDNDPSSAYQLAAQLAHTGIEGCDGAGLTIVHGRTTVETVAATDDMVLVADRLQYELGDGPCLDAVWEEEQVHSAGLRHDARWPVWGPRVVEETAAESVLAFQLFIHEDRLGALNLYSRAAGAFDADALAEGRTIAALVSLALTTSLKAQQLVEGMATRGIIGQAIGITMERYDLDAHAAFKFLTRISSTENIKLHDLATEIATDPHRGKDRL